MESEPLSLDLRGLTCPMPALRTRKALRALPDGARLVVACTDPLAAIDIPHLCQETGDLLEAQTREAGVLTFQIRRRVVGRPSPPATSGLPAGRDMMLAEAVAQPDVPDLDFTPPCAGGIIRPPDLS